MWLTQPILDTDPESQASSLSWKPGPIDTCSGPAGHVGSVQTPQVEVLLSMANGQLGNCEEMPRGEAMGHAAFWTCAGVGLAACPSLPSLGFVPSYMLRA